MAKSLHGAKIPHKKGTQGLATDIMPVPESVCILMLQHIGAPCTPQVQKGDTVKVGQIIGNSEAKVCAPIHSSVSGTVTEITEVLVPSGARIPAVVIQSDGEQTVAEGLAPPAVNSHRDLVNAVRTSGIVGLGGAGFPTHVKLDPPDLVAVHTLIINAAECEPYITSDNQTILEQFENLRHGMEQIMTHLSLKNCVIAIEDNKPEAIEKLKELASSDARVSVKVLSSLYPQGAEKVTIYNAMDGLIVPEGKLPADVGVIVSNVTTVAEIGRYLKTGMPLVNKRVTVDGSAITHRKNVLAPIGTSVKAIADFCGGYKGTPSKVLMGGPMMGISIANDNFPLLKNNNAFIFLDRAEVTRYEETPCISCGRCSRACPLNLMPSCLKNAKTNKDLDSLKRMKVNLCMECGCCSYVCPARQELVSSHREAKKMLQAAKA